MKFIQGIEVGSIDGSHASYPPYSIGEISAVHSWESDFGQSHGGWWYMLDTPGGISVLYADELDNNKMFEVLT